VKDESSTEPGPKEVVRRKSFDAVSVMDESFGAPEINRRAFPIVKDSNAVSLEQQPIPQRVVQNDQLHPPVRVPVPPVSDQEPLNKQAKAPRSTTPPARESGRPKSKPKSSLRTTPAERETVAKMNNQSTQGKASRLAKAEPPVSRQKSVEVRDRTETSSDARMATDPENEIIRLMAGEKDEFDDIFLRKTNGDDVEVDLS